MRRTLILRQIVYGIITALGVATLVFLLIRIIPGDPAELLLGDETDLITEEHIQLIRDTLGLNEPIWVQYALFIKSIFTGEFGTSFRLGETISHLISIRLPPTVALAIGGFIVALLVGIPSGILAAIKHNTWADKLIILFSTLGLSSPNFWVGLILLYIFAYKLEWFPIVGTLRDATIIDKVQLLILPSLAIGYRSASLLSRVTRAAVLEVLGQNYVQTARGKGLIERVVIARHALPNAMLPILTLLGINVAYLLGGSVVIEVVFARQGMGRLLIESIFARDYPVVQGAVLVIAFLVVAANLFVDLLYHVIDPRLAEE
jgi:ABC-type dipeptide/oligopeptide/nickel transport system permease component